MTMNIYAKYGDQVVFLHPNNGYSYDERNAKKHLKVGQVYTVDRTEVGGPHTDVYLQEIPSVAFNSVHFEDYIESPLLPAA